MGMDTVNLVIAIEKEFDIRILDADAEKLVLVGDMNDYVLRALRRNGETPDEAAVWQRLTDLIVEEVGVRPDEVTRTANIISDFHMD